MRKPYSELGRFSGAMEASRVVTLMNAMGIDAEARGASVWVEAERIDHARSLLAEAHEETTRTAAPVLPEPMPWTGHGALTVAAIVLLCAGLFIATYDANTLVRRARMIDYGAISYALVEGGEIWRLATAIFLHFDLSHLVSNMSVLALLGPPLAARLGPLRFLVLFLAAGVTGNCASHVWWGSAALKAGASGAIAGVLGGLGGYAWAGREPSRYKNWQVLGALLAIYGLLVGFGPGRDNTAHLFGMLSGAVYGWILREPS